MNEGFSFLVLTLLTTQSGMITRFLQVHPSDLKFPFELNKVTTCSIKLINKTDRDVAFKVKTTHPRKYGVFPFLGLISPGSTCVVEVSMQAQKVVPIGKSKKDKFLIQSVVAESGDKFRGITSDMFRKEVGNDLQEYKLRVVFVNANPPSPILEASEEGSSSDNSDLLRCRRSMLNNLEETLDSYQQRLREDSEIARVSRYKRLEEWAVISKLMEERSIALIQNRKLHSELERLREQPRQGRNRRVSLVWFMLVSVISLLVGCTFGKFG